MFCKKCGKEIEEGAAFCAVCGAPATLEEASVANPVQEETVTGNSVKRQALPVAEPVFSNNGSVDSGTPEKPPKKPIYKQWWFYAAIAAAAVIITIVAVFAGGKIEKNKWSEFVLSDMLPEPQASVNMIYENSEEELWVTFEGVTDGEYSKYVKSCADKGFTVDAKKDSNSYKAFNKDGYCLELSHYTDDLSIKLDAPMEFAAVSWPTGAAGSRLPEPKSLIGKFDYEYDDRFSVYIGDTSKADYEEYIKACADNGFTVDYDKGDDYYNADDGEGWSISVKYEGNSIMNIQIDAPSEKTDEDNESTPTASYSESSSSAESKPSSESKPAETGSGENLVDGMRKEFKDAIDSYEKFMDEYVAFMKKYKENPNDINLLSDYSKYMSKYSDMCSKFNKLGSENMNSAEIAYYIDVQTRVNQKLLEVAN